MTREVMRAIFKDDFDKLNSIVEKGFDLNFVTEKEKWNLLHRSLVSLSLRASPKMISHIIHLGVKIDTEDAYGNTALHYASRLKYYDAIEILLDCGADVDHVNEDGITPLRHALTSRPYDLKCVETLISWGADIEHRSGNGVSVLEYVEMIAHDDIGLLALFKRGQV